MKNRKGQTIPQPYLDLAMKRRNGYDRIILRLQKKQFSSVSMVAANGSGISDVAEYTHHSRHEEPQLIKVQMFNRSTSAAILLIPC